jgi:hypothetical protein
MQDSFEENHYMLWKEEKILEIEANSVCTKYKEAAYMSCLQNPSADPALKFRPFGTAYSDQHRIV